MNTIAPPEIMPARAPVLVVLLQNKENSITGPKDAPKPAQAKDTMVKIELLGSLAIKAAITAIITTVSLAASIVPFSDILRCSTSFKIF